MGYNGRMSEPQIHILGEPPREEFARVAPPHAFAAEQALLGAVLLNNELLDELDGVLTAAHFYDSRHVKLFECVQTLAAEKHADIIMLAQELKNQGKLAEAGGEEYLAAVAGIAAAPVNVRAYAEEIKKTAQRRQILKALAEANARALQPGASAPQEILDETGAALSEIYDSNFSSGGMTSASEKAEEFFNNFTDIINKKEFDRLLGLQTGYPALDKMTTGLHGGDLAILAGRPGSGKTAFALNIIRHASAKGAGVVVFSLEMSDEQLVMRLISQDRMDMQKLRTARDRRGNPIGLEDLSGLANAVSHLRNRNIFIDDSGTLNVLEVKSRARRMARKLARQDGLSLIVVDYLQLLSAAPGDKGDNRALEVAAISRGLKSLAKELNVPVLAMSQLNRSVESRAAKEPLLSDLRESGSIEQDADIVMFLHEEKNGERDYESPPAEGTPVKLIIGKQRNGPTGQIMLQFHKQFSRFAEAARDESGRF